LNGISFCICCKPPSQRQGKPVRLDRILRTLWSLFASSLSFYMHLFSWHFYSSVPICTVKNLEIYFGPCHFRGPLAHDYK
jgi:hypothetical protein